MGLNKKQRDRVEILMKEGMSHDKAFEKVMNAGAVDAVKKQIEPTKPISKTESKVKSFLVQSKMNAKLKEAQRKKERLNKLSKMSIEQLKELKVEKEK
jgi:response regulator RpfG family c-di-GMP phosphodiesterase